MVLCQRRVVAVDAPEHTAINRREHRLRLAHFLFGTLQSFHCREQRVGCHLSLHRQPAQLCLQQLSVVAFALSKHHHTVESLHLGLGQVFRACRFHLFPQFVVVLCHCHCHGNYR